MLAHVCLQRTTKFRTDSILEGLEATGGDALVEATLRSGGEPGLSSIRAALAQGMHVVISSKGPMALAGLELLSLARTQSRATAHGVHRDIGHARGQYYARMDGRSQHPRAAGLLNGTVNSILSALVLGQMYAEALAQAQAQGYGRSRSHR